MALDSSLFAAKIPAATYAVGDRIDLGIIRGPAVVRSGYGSAILKKVFTTGTPATTGWIIHVRNANWIDDMANISVTMNETTLDDNSVNIQRGHDCPLTPNSSWEVWATCYIAGTESADTQVFALIDIDYPSVASIKNPRQEVGAPVTIPLKRSVTITAATADPSTTVWNMFTVDIFKAGYRYLLDQMSCRVGSVAGLVFVEISGAAGQNGLTRIVPCRSSVAGIRYLIDYATPLVKGPMNVAIATYGTAGTADADISSDWVKR